jgi:hypothetical protein
MQIWGEAVGSNMTMTVVLNGQQVFQGPIPSRNQWSGRSVTQQGDDWILAQFDFPMDTHGNVSLSLQATGGDFYYTQTKTNYHGATATGDYIGVSPEATWPLGRPATDAEIMQDSSNLTSEQWMTKYGQRRRECLIRAHISSAGNWEDANGSNTADNDGRLNVRVANSPMSLDVTARQQHGLMGDWAYLVPQDQPLICDLQIVPPIVD